LNDGYTCDVTIVTAWYPPEVAPIGHMMRELAESLVEHGLRVDVVTSVPNHPRGILFTGWRNRVLQLEEPRPGLRVLRVGALLRPASAQDRPRGKLHRILAYLAFTALVCLRAFWNVRPRVIFGVLQPLTIGPVLGLLARWRGARLVYNIQDLHPDAAVSLGLIRNALLIRMLLRIESQAYRRADALSVICEGFREHCVARGASAANVAVIPNWIDLDEVLPLTRPSALRSEIALPPGAFIALYAGTIGYVSGAQVVLEAAALLAGTPDIHIVFVGDGPLVATLRSEADARKLTQVHFLPFQPRERLNDVQGLGDVSLVTLLHGHGRTSVPSKVLGYMAAARPVLAAVDADSETARVVRAAGAGIVTPAGDAAALADAIRRLYDDRELARSLGGSGRRHLETSQSKAAILDSYHALFARMLGRL